MLYNKILTERNFIQNQINALEQQLSTLPSGNIYYVHDKNQIKWFHNDGTQTRYLLKKEQELKEALAYKKYLSLLQKDYQHELDALNSYLKHHNQNIIPSSQELLYRPEYRSLLSPSLQPLSEELSDWAEAPYEKSKQHPQHLIFPSISGNILRSKSESIIDMLLFHNKIPYRYECALSFPECIIYPDFTIRHPKTGKYYYWEHFGLMDDPQYSKNAYSKIQLFISHQIIPGENLIMTFETKQFPLTSDKVNDIIRQSFL